MRDGNFWKPKELRKYVAYFRRVQGTQRKRIEEIRRKIENGDYLTDDVASATARKMLARRFDEQTPFHTG